MRIVCPTCEAAYDVPDHLMAAGKRTRCARCAREWIPQPDVPPPAEPVRPVVPDPPVAAPPPPPPPPRLVVPPPLVAKPEPPPVPRAEPVAPVARDKAPSRRPVAIALGGSVLVLVAMLGAAVQWRGPIMQAWSPLERLYGWVGLK
jgi:predicted Zn finger-like uncharacterized protein